MPFSPAYPNLAFPQPAYPAVDVLGPAYPSGFTDLWSAKFVRAASQYLNMSNANFGAVSSTTLTYSVLVKRSSGATIQIILGQWAGGVDNSILFGFDAFDRAEIATYSGGVAYTTSTIAPFSSTSLTYHLVYHVDTTAGTNALRARIWVDGVEMSMTGTASSTPMDSVTADWEIGAFASGVQNLDAIINESALVSGRLAAPSEFVVAGIAQDLTGMAGLHSWPRFENDWSDSVLATDWTPMNAPTFVSNP